MYQRISVTLLLCYASAVIAGEKHKTQRVPSKSVVANPATPLEASAVQYAVPFEANFLQPQQAITPYNSPPIYISQEGVAPYAANSGPYGYFAYPDSRFTISPAAVKITTPSVAAPIQEPVLIHPIDHRQKVQQVPSIQYLPVPAAEVANVRQPAPIRSKAVTFENQQAVTVHPPPTAYTPPKQHIHTQFERPVIQYVTVPATYPVSPAVGDAYQGYYAQTSPVVTNQVPVPVLYNRQNAVRPQYFVISGSGQPAPGAIRYSTDVPVQQVPISIPYPQDEASIRYNNPISVVYPKNVAHASKGFQPVPYGGYARAAKFSPATAVSKVSFTGSGVQYGW